MSFFNKYLWPSILAVAVAQPALAADDDATAEEKPIWSGSAELGSIWTNGNTKTSSVNGQVDVKREGELWVSRAKFSALGSKDDDNVTKEKYNGLVQLDRNITEKFYVAMVAQQERDRFSGFKYQGTATAGLGYHAIKTKSQILDLELAPGYYRERERESGNINESAIARFALNYDWTIREGVSFIEEFSADIGEENKVYRSETGLKSQINGSLATKITYKVKHVDEAPEDKKKTDTEFGVTLVYSF